MYSASPQPDRGLSQCIRELVERDWIRFRGGHQFVDTSPDEAELQRVVVARRNEDPPVGRFDVQPAREQEGPVDRAFGRILLNANFRKALLLQHVSEKLVPRGGGLGREAVAVDELVPNRGSVLVDAVHDLREFALKATAVRDVERAIPLVPIGTNRVAEQTSRRRPFGGERRI